MIQQNLAKPASQLMRVGKMEHAFPSPAPSHPARATAPTGLAASSDTAMLQMLAEFTLKSGVTTLLADSVDEARRILDRQEVQLVLCDDRLIDGNYEDILRVVRNSSAAPPVIVISPTGEWPDYLDAMNAGAFDYLPYPPITGELLRVIRYALALRRLSNVEETSTNTSDFRPGEIT